MVDPDLSVFSIILKTSGMLDSALDIKLTSSSGISVSLLFFVLECFEEPENIYRYDYISIIFWVHFSQSQIMT